MAKKKVDPHSKTKRNKDLVAIRDLFSVSQQWRLPHLWRIRNPWPSDQFAVTRPAVASVEMMECRQ